MATDAEVKSGLPFGTNHFGISAKTINDAQLVRIKAWFTASFPTELGGETVTSEISPVGCGDRLGEQLISTRTTSGTSTMMPQRLPISRHKGEIA
jgi:hypothetical protein